MKYIRRLAALKIGELSANFPLIYLTGPRQNGKSVFLKSPFFNKFEYISLEEIHARKFAFKDPRGFLNNFKSNVIIDDAHSAPSLIPYIKERFDSKKPPVKYILSGCLNPKLSKSISRYFSGRAVKIILLPFSSAELERAGRLPKTANEWMFMGNYPELFSSTMSTQFFFHRYTTTVLEQDIKPLLKMRNFDKFIHFLTIIAANSCSPVNLSQIGEETYMDARTVNSWISILEEKFILFRLTPYHGFAGKRYTKTPKLYFYDTGFLCFLLGINNSEDLNFHPMRGQIFETAVVSEIAKKYFNAGYKPRMNYWRDLDNSEKEIDLVEESGLSLKLTEIRLSQTPNEEYAKNLMEISPSNIETSSQVIYDGSEDLVFENIRYTNWKSLSL